jgi:two-component system sensor kinase FixL
VDLAVSEARVGHRRLFTGVLRDLTDRKRAEAEVRKLQRVVQERGRLADVGAVTAQIVHDLGNPLAGLSMQVQRLARAMQRGGASAAGTVASMTDQILASVRRLDTMLHELRDFARQQRLDLTEVDLLKLLMTTREVWNPVAAAKGVELHVNFGGRTERILADEHKLLRVLDNLVKNAIEAIEQWPGKVTLALEAGTSPRHAVRISISDNGSGIPENFDVFRLFETTKESGSGLGLSIARRIVEAHGGGLSFARIDPHGTVFHIDLPARANQPSAASNPTVG